MEENSRKRLWEYMLPEIGCMAFAVLVIWGLFRAGVLGQQTDRMVCHIVLVALGIGTVGFSLRLSGLRQELDYDNDKHILRFWICFLACLVIAFACAFLPAASWPFLPVFVGLVLFSNLNTGALSGAVLLAIPACLAGIGAEVYLLYMMSGIFGAVLFQRLNRGFKTRTPILLSLGFLFVCLTAGTVLMANARLSFEYFVVPIANLITSGLMLFGILKYFFSATIYSYRDNYLDLNDTENEILSAWKQENKDAYLKGVHTAHFCERIAAKLELNAEALKCAAYYHGIQGEISELSGQYSFPPETLRILEDFRNASKGILYKETAVLLASNHVISAVKALQAEGKDKPAEYDRVIDGIFQRYYEKGVFGHCNITVNELQIMQEIFKEEKLYYDFLR